MYDVEGQEAAHNTDWIRSKGRLSKRNQTAVGVQDEVGIGQERNPSCGKDRISNRNPNRDIENNLCL